MNVSVHERQPNVLQASIAAGTTTSSVVDLSGYSILGLVALSALPACKLSFRVSHVLAGPFVDLVSESSGLPLETNLVSGQFALPSNGILGALAAYRYICIVMSVAPSSDVQFAIPVRA
ncbi:MAG: hypothetical protein KatS3mg038_1012 [Candidatus Kapaibacterium sp.]|nr:MAG: hypothetical protein KatS3mg038_1012 [Candidatus Kapabacteria bacterium]